MIERMPQAAAAHAAWGGPPCVVARSLRDVRRAAAIGRPFALLSTRAAASFAGCLAWQAIARGAREEFAALIGADILDCADASGRALEALRLGQAMLVLDEDAVGFADVRARAAAIGAEVLARRPPAFDLGITDRPSPGRLRALAAFLETPPP